MQYFRVTTDLPEPTAKLYQIQSGDTAELLARREFSSSVQDGHDLRYYENVLLHVNREHGRAGITGTFQDPNILGGGSNNIQLVAGSRIWLVSPAYALALQNIVPDGSLTNGAVAGARRVFGHLEDILASVTDSPQYFLEVAGEYAQAIIDHLPEIIGITAGFIVAESASAFLAATPTGVGQIAALLIQLAIAAFGAHFAVEAAGMALEYAQQWLTIAWTCNGDPGLRAEASRYFLRMLVQIAMAALAIAGVSGSMGNAASIADAIHITPPTLGWSPGMVTPEGVIMGGGPVFTPGSIASSGPVAISGNAMMSSMGGGGGAASLGARANGLEHRAGNARRAAEALPDDAPGKVGSGRRGAPPGSRGCHAARAGERVRRGRKHAARRDRGPRGRAHHTRGEHPRCDAIDSTSSQRPAPSPASSSEPAPHQWNASLRTTISRRQCRVRTLARGWLPRPLWQSLGVGPRSARGAHWDVQHPNGTHTNIYPDGIAHQGIDNFGR